MIPVIREYTDRKTGRVVEIPLTFSGHADDRIIEQYYIEEVKNQPSVKVVWKYSGKTLST